MKLQQSSIARLDEVSEGYGIYSFGEEADPFWCNVIPKAYYVPRVQHFDLAGN